MNKFTMSYKDLKSFVALLEKHDIDIASEKAAKLFESYKKVIQ